MSISSFLPSVRAAVRSVLDDVTLAQVLSGDLPEQIQDLLSSPGAWRSR